MKIHSSVRWNGNTAQKSSYSRSHVWSFDGGATVNASASPDIVPEPASNPAYVDPEEAVVVALSSCHMLFFLHIATDSGYNIKTYEDDAIGIMSDTATCRYIDKIRLHPKVEFDGETPSEEVHKQLHHEAHALCFIANSLKSEITIVPESVSNAELASTEVLM